MRCLKCGRETKSDQSFCDRCSEGMKQYPVTPDTVLLLPTAKAITYNRRSGSRRKSQPSEQEQIRRLKLRVRRLVTAVIILALLLVGVSWFSTRQILKAKGPLPGQNYSTVTTKPVPTEK